VLESIDRQSGYMAPTIATLGPIFGAGSTGSLTERISKTPTRPAMSMVPNVILLASGESLKSGDETLGALGIGGAPGGPTGRGLRCGSGGHGAGASELAGRTAMSLYAPAGIRDAGRPEKLSRRTISSRLQFGRSQLTRSRNRPRCEMWQRGMVAHHAASEPLIQARSNCQQAADPGPRRLADRDTDPIRGGETRRGS